MGQVGLGLPCNRIKHALHAVSGVAVFLQVRTLVHRRRSPQGVQVGRSGQAVLGFRVDLQFMQYK